MSSKSVQIGLVVLLILVYGATSVLKAEQKTSPQSPGIKASDANSVIEQKTCPVMGGPINKNIYTVYKGKKVYFCCGGCKPKFEKNPEKYIDKLPQFQK